MSVYALIVLRSLLVFDTLLLLVVGAGLAYFMEFPAGVLFGAGCWLLAGMLIGAVRHVDRLYDRRG
ncbi:hypothetical protein HDA40_001311 [Hamadaea flava]|uniref:Uncharacterized protein n=1 Tax=Hamadaea flava TaxID=1742688 RepID=A0ABV8LNR6_9ACTN|nr:hypothetical protein [Hamadaea flava]MCP2322804.1 hypothetical protein [Hamadaea flava]